MKNLIAQSKIKSQLGATIRNGVRYANYERVEVRLALDENGETKVYTISRGCDGLSTVSHMINCVAIDKWDQEKNFGRASFYSDEASFERAMKRIQRIYNKSVADNAKM